MINLEHLWRKIQEGDKASFAILYEEFYPRLCYYAFQLLNDKFLAEETVQDIFLRVWEMRAGIFSQGNSLRAYLYRLTHNQCLDQLKKQKTQKANVVKLFPSEMWVSISEKYGFDEFLIEKLESEETKAMLQTAIEKLPAQCREIFVQSRIEDKTNEEIAGQMGLSVNTVRTQIYRALQKLKDEMNFMILCCISF